MDRIYINGVKTKFTYSDGGSVETFYNNRKNGLQAIFIWGKAINGKFLPTSEMTLPLGMFQNGGTCHIYGKEYKITKAELKRMLDYWTW